MARRWTLSYTPGPDGFVNIGPWTCDGPKPKTGEYIEVMPVAEHASLRDAAIAVLDVYDVFPTRGWRELAALRRALGQEDEAV